ncbi:Long-chain-fatty-acid--CoA ligase 1 [Panicum miliaceum]|uniref:Long-chain-fatty-acid--CoA ligase 1 n=1 Tax=Panicum miliaceum TaxID=4540 RepID=A0A3L6QFY8_PANMI|nr:Long-chain-fatty-acid--CoA ligase 1 [Panicum miliaceum]
MDFFSDSIGWDWEGWEYFRFYTAACKLACSYVIFCTSARQESRNDELIFRDQVVVAYRMMSFVAYRIFWLDGWLDGASIQNLAPNLSCLVPARFRNKRTVGQALANQRWTRDITGTLNELALSEFEQLWEWLQGVQLQERTNSSGGGHQMESTKLALHTVWWEILRRLGFRSINPLPRQSLQEWWLSLCMQLPKPKRKGFGSLCALVCWQLWKESNARLFRGVETHTVPSAALNQG